MKSKFLHNGSGSEKRFPTKLAFALVFLLSCSVPADAAFSPGWLETFDGTSIDTATWRLVNPQGISQNDALFFAVANDAGRVTELITTDVVLGIGGLAQVQVTFSALTSTPNYSTSAYLALTTDSSGVGVPWDSYGLITELMAGPFNTGLIGSTPISVTNIAPFRAFPVTLDTTYSLRLERLTDTSVRYTALNSVGVILGQITRTLPSYPDPLYIALGARSTDANFDNLQLYGNIVPEPSTLSLIGLGPIVLVILRRRRWLSCSKPGLQ